MLAGLAILGDASLEAALRRVNDKDGDVGREVPVIMFLMKSRWPRASITVK